MNATCRRLQPSTLLGLLLLLSLTLQAAGQGSNYYYTSKGSISFRSDAPQEIIGAESDHLQGLISPDKNSFVFRVLIRTFSGFNSALQQEHFNEKYLESEKFPEAIFTGKIIEDIDLATDGTNAVRAKGKLKIHGVEQERIIRAKIEIRNGVLHLVSQFTVLLADHSIKVPKVVHEKIASEINITVRAELTIKAMK